MEIFQTIWTALTTPNEALTNKLIVPFSFVEIYVIMLVFINFLNIQSTKSQRKCYFLLISGWTIISTLFIPKDYTMFINLLILPTSVFFIFKTTVLKSILSLVIPSLLTALLDSIISKILLLCFSISVQVALTTPIYRIIVTCIIYFTLYIVARLMKRLNFSLNLFDNMNKKNKIILIIIFFLGSISIGTQFYLVQYYTETLPLFITFLSFVTLIAYFLTSMYSLLQTNELHVTEQNLEEVQLYNKSLKILHDNLRGFKHDFSNIVQSIGGYIATNDINGLKVYYSQLLDDCQKVNNLYTLSPDVINNPAIYSLLTSKYHKADSLGIKINLEVFLNLNELNMKIYEFTRILRYTYG